MTGSIYIDTQIDMNDIAVAASVTPTIVRAAIH
jgi:hypothetical protein